jgi:putative transposase
LPSFSGETSINELRRLRRLEHENSQLQRVVADLTLDNQALKELAREKV